MQSNNKNNQSNAKASVFAQARLLMSSRRQKEQNRYQSMLQRSAAELGLDQ